METQHSPALAPATLHPAEIAAGAKPSLPDEELQAVAQPDAYDPANPYGYTEAELYERARKRAAARKDILFGALWCVGGSIATAASDGLIFWGAIVFGGIQCIKGIFNYS